LYARILKINALFLQKALIIELDRGFIVRELMNATNIIYLQYWVQPESTLTFFENLQIFKSHYCYQKMTQPNGKSHAPLLDHVLLEQ
jgi:hypothetical protein